MDGVLLLYIMLFRLTKMHEQAREKRKKTSETLCQRETTRRTTKPCLYMCVCVCVCAWGREREREREREGEGGSQIEEKTGIGFCDVFFIFVY